MMHWARENYALVIYMILLGLGLVFGGASRDGEGAKIVIAIICSLLLGAFVIIDRKDLRQRRLIRPIGILCGLLGLWICVQLIPLPYEFWAKLSSRETIKSEMELLNIVYPGLPVSLNPGQSKISAIMFMPAILAYYLGCKIKPVSYPILFWSLVLMTLCSAILGLFQISVPRGGDFYLWSNVNNDRPVGVFANINHQAILMVMSLPFLEALITQRQSSRRHKDLRIARVIVLAALFLIIATVLLFAGSVAGYVLAAMALCITGFSLIKHYRNAQYGMLAIMGLMVVLVFALIIFSTTPLLQEFGVTHLASDELSRIGMITKSFEIYADHWLWGSGLGSFETIYPLYEDPANVTGTFVNHAHNDYLEWVLETGLPGFLLLAGFLIWWAKQLYLIAAKNTQHVNNFAKAAALTTLIIALHSLVDYPLRTLPISMIGALCLAIVATSSSQKSTSRQSLKTQL